MPVLAIGLVGIILFLVVIILVVWVVRSIL
jgi:hypothetical protein